MGKVAELIELAIIEGNLEQGAGTTHADVLGALGRADPLGAALARVQADMLPASFNATSRLLAARLAPDAAPGGVIERMNQKAAVVALYEHMDTACDACAGTGSPAPMRAICKRCNGSGKKIHTAAETAQLLGVPGVRFRPWAAVIARAKCILRRAAADCERQVAHQLGVAVA